MTVTPSGGDDTPALLAAGARGDDIGAGTFRILSSFGPLPNNGFALNGRGKRLTNFAIGPGVSAFNHHGQAVGITIRGISFIGTPNRGSSVGQIWGAPNPGNPADVSGYLSLVTIEDCEFVFTQGELDVRYCMGGLTVSRCDWNACGNGLRTYDCGEFDGNSLRFNTITGFQIFGEGPDQGSTGGDHSAEDWKLANCTGNGGGQGVTLKNVGFGSITGCDFTAITGAPALWLLGTCSDLAVSASVWGGINEPGRQQSAVVLDDTTFPQPRGPHHSIVFENCKMDGSTAGIVANGDEITITACQMTANSNCDIIAPRLTNSLITNNHLDSCSWLYGSAQSSVAEFGTSRNNTVRGNRIRKDAGWRGVGSLWTDNQVIS